MSEVKLKIQDIVGEISLKSGDNERIGKVAVIGLGTMGRGIAQTISSAGIEVLGIEKNDQTLRQSLDLLSQGLDQEISRWAITKSEKKSLLSHIKSSVSLDDVRECDLIIESVDENYETKIMIFQKLDEIAKQTAILASNTSTLNLSKLASATKRPEKIIGMHFLNPVPKTPVVELVRGKNTSDDTHETVKRFAERIGKTAIEVFEFPGFITTRIIVSMLNEAFNVLMDGVASADGIDQAMRLGYNLPMGPLEMADSIGLDEVLTWLESLWSELGESHSRPCPLLRRLVREGKLGKKSGEGFFKYDSNNKKINSNLTH